MSALNQQTLAESGANERPPMLEKGNYIPWESRFRRFLDNKLKEGERMWRSIEKGPYERPMIPDPDNTMLQIIKLLSKMTEINKKQYMVDVKVMNYLFQAIPNDIYNSVDASKEGESLESVYERLTILVNIMDLQFEPHVQASKEKRAARNHDPLALIAYSNASPSQSHAIPSYLHSPQPYYVTHPSSVVDYEEDYQGELQGDSQQDKLTTAVMLLARAITKKFSTPTNNRLRTSSNTRNQAVIQDDRVDIQTKNAGYGGNSNRNAGRQNRNQAFNAGNRSTQNNKSNHIVQRALRTKLNPGKAYVQYEAGSNLNEEENDFMLDNSFGDETLEELTTVVIMMAQIQPADDNAMTEPAYDAKAVSEVNASYKMIPKGVYEHKNHGKRKTIINTFDDDQIDSNIIFDDPYVENNGGSAEHDSNAHDLYHEIQILAYNIQKGN
ncbi:hypothetical protein Tco_0881965 [Tanacetum coccineum]